MTDDRSNDPIAWDAFLKLCALVAPDRQAGTDLPAEHWDLIVKLAQEHKVEQAVWPGIAHDSSAPLAVKAYFHTVRNMNARRNAGLLDNVLALAQEFERAGIKAVLLKGAASLASGLYQDPAGRLMLDVDLLVAPGQAKAGVKLLQSLGYGYFHRARWVEKPSHQLPPILAPSGEFCVELHTAVTSRAFAAILPAAQLMERATAIQHDGRSALVLHPTDRVAHNVVHAQLHHELAATGGIELRQLVELALLARRYDAEIDWDDIRRRFESLKLGTVLLEQAVACRLLLDTPLPLEQSPAGGVMERLRQAILHPHVAWDPFDYEYSFRKALTRMVGLWLQDFARHPRLLLNLADPRLWPQGVVQISNTLRFGHRHSINAAVAARVQARARASAAFAARSNRSGAIDDARANKAALSSNAPR